MISSKAQPDFDGGSLWKQAELYYAERELEEVFKYSLMFTETEGILIWEFLVQSTQFFY